MRRWLELSLLLLACAGCSSGSEGNLVPQGAKLFESRELSSSKLNLFSCSTCHDPSATPSDLELKTGAPLAGATLRSSFWGGQEVDLLRSINACREHFMDDSTPLAADDPKAEALYAYLVSLEPGNTQAIPFTVVRSTSDLPRGNAASGQALFSKSCAHCHGGLHDGAGRSSERIPILPEETTLEHTGFDARHLRLVFIEKIRHGGFLGYGGDMPPYSKEVLSDTNLSDLLEALAVLGE